MLSSTATSFGTRLDSWKMPFCDKLTYLRKVFLHLLSNTWVTIPWRARSQTQQMHRGSEICWSLALSGFGIMGTWAVAASLMKSKSPRFLPETEYTSSNEFLLLAALPALASHLLGCAVLFLHYQWCHPWRNLFTWQKRQDLVEETPCWEQVKAVGRNFFCNPY